MKLKQYALIAEIISGVAIVVSLVFLIVEIRSATNAIQSSNRQSIAERWEAITLERAGNLELTRILAKVGEESELTREENLMFRSYLGAIRTNLEEVFLLYRDGDLDQEYFEARSSGELGPLFFGNTAAQEAFSVWKSVDLMTDAFESWMEQELVDRYPHIYGPSSTQ